MDCPGCGLVRSFCAFSKGQIIAAFHFHALGPFLYGGLLLVWIQSLLRMLGWTQQFSGWYRAPWDQVFVSLFLVHWVVRLALDT
jgi:hypothetical protein